MLRLRQIESLLFGAETIVLDMNRNKGIAPFTR